MIWLLAACGLPPGPGPGLETAEPRYAAPSIARFAVGCDADANRWNLTVEATAWAGSALTYWTVDGEYLEVHRITSVSYQEDGSGETYSSSINMVSDWRSQADNVSTMFTCAQPVDIMLALQDLDGVVVGCAALGPRPGRWDTQPGVPVCPDR